MTSPQKPSSARAPRWRRSPPRRRRCRSSPTRTGASPPAPRSRGGRDRWYRTHPRPDEGSGPGTLRDVSGTLFFAANDGTDGRELWKSDGTEDGTDLVEDINPGDSGSFPTEAAAVDGALYFQADDGTHGAELWKSDGGTLYFQATDGDDEHGFELWRSNGTEAGTALVKDIRPGGSSLPIGLAVIDGMLFFNADDGVHGRELWRLDPTASSADLTLNKRARPKRPAVGETLTYPIFVGSNGPDPAAEVVLEDTLPASVEFLDVRTTRGTCAHESGVVRCELGNLGTGRRASASVAIDVRPTERGRIHNAATVSAATPDPDTGNNTAGATNKVID